MHNKNKQNITVRLKRLESDYNRSQIRLVLIALPTLILSLAVSLTAMTVFIAMVLIPLLGDIIGILIGAALFIDCISIVGLVHSNLVKYFFPSGDQHPVINKFDKAFPVHDKDERERAIDILDENFDKYKRLYPGFSKDKIIKSTII